VSFVKKQPGQTEDQLIAQFRKKVVNEEVLEESSKHDFYQKPSMIRYEKFKDLRRRKKRKKAKKGSE